MPWFSARTQLISQSKVELVRQMPGRDLIACLFIARTVRQELCFSRPLLFRHFMALPSMAAGSPVYATRQLQLPLCGAQVAPGLRDAGK